MDISDSSRSAPPGVAENAPTFPIIDALSGNSIQINLPLGSSVRELREASAASLGVNQANLLLLCSDEASDEVPVLLRDGEWLSHYALPHDEKTVFCFDTVAISAAASGDEASNSGQARGHLLEKSEKGWMRSSIKHHDSGASLTGSNMDEVKSDNAALLSLSTLSKKFQQSAKRAQNITQEVRGVVDAMQDALQSATRQNQAIDALLVYAEEKQHDARVRQDHAGGEAEEAALLDSLSREEQELLDLESFVKALSTTPGPPAIARWLSEHGCPPPSSSSSSSSSSGKKKGGKPPAPEQGSPDSVLSLGQGEGLWQLVEESRLALALARTALREREKGGGEEEDGASPASVSKRYSLSLDIEDKLRVTLEALGSSLRHAADKTPSLSESLAAITAVAAQTCSRAERLAAALAGGKQGAEVDRELAGAVADAERAAAQVDRELEKVLDADSKIAGRQSSFVVQWRAWQLLVAQHLQETLDSGAGVERGQEWREEVRSALARARGARERGRAGA
eukprot:CAMPEP_0177725390 /NCGR_PEP_ID=MMETSP0484_2-20121128/19225_1 /TAXON_ID=354590 /ORGANISM="Rhodomonas lens, Strain RHODO" /LENGTH=511 /DNA_ID=CAMNT_0019237899 /DNA_START=81 /DNA_END=1613 /DNA_ORIENTATION=-